MLSCDIGYVHSFALLQGSSHSLLVGKRITSKEGWVKLDGSDFLSVCKLLSFMHSCHTKVALGRINILSGVANPWLNGHTHDLFQSQLRGAIGIISHGTIIGTGAITAGHTMA